MAQVTAATAPDGSAAYRAWRRRLTAQRAAVRRGGYVGYATLLAVLMYGSMLWSLLTSAFPAGGQAPPGAHPVLPSGSGVSPLALGLLATGLLALGAVAAARFGLPLTVSRPAATFELSGQFSPAVVFRRRALLTLAGAVLIGGSLGLAVGLGMARGAVAPGFGRLFGFAAFGMMTAVGAVTLGAIAQVGERWRTVAGLIAGAVTSLGVFLSLGGLSSASSIGGIVGRILATWGISEADVIDQLSFIGSVGSRNVIGSLTSGDLFFGTMLVATLGLATWLMLVVVPGRIDPDKVAAQGTKSLGVAWGLSLGESQALSWLAASRFSGSRTLISDSQLLAAINRRSPIIARDLAGLRRRPLITATALVAVLAGAVLILTTPSLANIGGIIGIVGIANPATTGATVPTIASGAAIIGALLVYAATGGLARGLTAFAQQPNPGGLLPGSPHSVMAQHLVIPLIVILLTLLTAAFALFLADATVPTHTLLTAAAVSALALGIRSWVSSHPNMPTWLRTPIPTPLGDLALANTAIWLLRGWLGVAVLTVAIIALS